MKLALILSLTLVALGFATGSKAQAQTPQEIQSCSAMLEMASKAAKPADLTVSISGLRNLKGHVLVSVYGDRCGGFPNQAELAVFKKQLPATALVKLVVELPPGNYAIAILHDANDNQKMDTFAGIPKEGFGFSNNAMQPFGPPTFEQAKLVVPAAGLSTTMKMKYML